MKHKVLIALILAPLLLLTCCNKASIDTNNYFTISFDSNGGSEVPSFKVKEGEKINVPNDPTYDNYVFDYWEVLSGSYIHEQFTYVDGESYRDEKYFNDEEGYLIPQSDMTFIARWRNAYNPIEINPIEIWHAILFDHSDLNEHISSAATSMDVQAYAELKGHYSDLRRALDSARTIGVYPDAILIANTICNGNIEDLDYEYNPGAIIEDFSEYYMPFYDVQNQLYVLNSFDESIYQYVYDSDEQRVFGFPICSYATMMRSKEGENNIPGTTTIYGFINKYKFEGGGDKNAQRIATENYLKALSRSYLN
jgi:hypothetical protein